MRKLVVLMLGLLASFAALAQDTAGAEAAVQNYATAMKSYNAKALADLMHPEALKQFRTTFDRVLSGPKRDEATSVLLPLFAVETVAEYSAISDSELFRRFYDTIAKMSPELIGVMTSATYEIIGTFIKSDTAHVTFNIRMNVDGSVVNAQEVQKVKMHNGTWLLLLPSSAEASMAGLEAQFN